MQQAAALDVAHLECLLAWNGDERCSVRAPYLPAGNFYIMVLRKHGTLVSAATVRCCFLPRQCVGRCTAACRSTARGACCRVFGIHFAEMPFVATRQCFRREGNCRRIMKVCRLYKLLPGHASSRSDMASICPDAASYDCSL